MQARTRALRLTIIADDRLKLIVRMYLNHNKALLCAKFTSLNCLFGMGKQFHSSQRQHLSAQGIVKEFTAR